jgi:hypothetical protein
MSTVHNVNTVNNVDSYQFSTEFIYAILTITQRHSSRTYIGLPPVILSSISKSIAGKKWMNMADSLNDHNEGMNFK